ncbi:hypothetical protein QG516_05875 [Pedobacter gandavensis]|uniref:hypothetical protein n=1 Tax=Pedobacter TaxID=84567 RepID=UPI001C9977CA|nr:MULTISPECIES: hypothetical protein [Pedobacter]WGQ11182.1 hypothetical protein QG516_05875 [Pedobacter gandavensis]
MKILLNTLFLFMLSHYALGQTQKICKPLLLKNTYYTFKVEVKKNEVSSYNTQNKYVKNGNVNFSNHPASIN